MRLFGNIKTKHPAPEWTPFANLFLYDKFIELVLHYFAKKEMTGLVDEDLLVVEDPQWVYSKMGLANLAQLCNHYRPSKWKSIIREHFDAMKSQAEFESEFYENVHDYSYAAPFIAIRVHPKEYASHLGEEFTIKQQIAEDLIALLVFDFPHGISTIRPETTIQWKKTNEQLLETGLANIRKNYASETAAEDFHGTKIWLIQGDHHFVTSSVLELQLQPVPIGADGALIGIPNRHTVMIYPIDSFSTLNNVLGKFVYVLKESYKDGPGSISESLYWWHKGNLIRQPYSVEGDSLHFEPTGQFIEMMDSLPAQP